MEEIWLCECCVVYVWICYCVLCWLCVVYQCFWVDGDVEVGVVGGQVFVVIFVMCKCVEMIVDCLCRVFVNGGDVFDGGVGVSVDCQVVCRIEMGCGVGIGYVFDDIDVL